MISFANVAPNPLGLAVLSEGSECGVISKAAGALESLSTMGGGYKMPNEGIFRFHALAR